MVVRKEQVAEKMKNSQVIILNVLSKAAFQKLHIKGSENMPLTEDHKAFSVEVEKKYGKDKLFITCGDRFGTLDSYEAAKALSERGLKAENYSGGVQEWYKAGFPSEGTQTELVAAAPSANPPTLR